MIYAEQKDTQESKKSHEVQEAQNQEGLLMVRVTPVSKIDGQYIFAAINGGKSKPYEYPTRKNARRARANLIKTFKSFNMKVEQQ